MGANFSRLASALGNQANGHALLHNGAAGFFIVICKIALLASVSTLTDHDRFRSLNEQNKK